MLGGIGREVIDLVHCLGFIYLRHGQPYRAVVLLMIAAQSAPERADILRTLCGAMIAAGLGAQALEVWERLRLLEPAMQDHPMMRLLRARALLLQGDLAAARAAFMPPTSIPTMVEQAA